MNRTSISLPLLTAAILILGYPIDARGYIDPGAGSVLLQGILGAVAAGSAIIAAYWRSIRLIFTKNPRNQQHPND